MPYIDVRVNIPSGLYCGGCSFNPKGTIVCNLFDEFLEEDDHGKFKCEYCKSHMIED